MRHAVPLTALLFALAACDDGGSTKPGTDPADAQPGPGADAGPVADAAPMVDPTIAITAPMDGAFVRTRRVEVTGTVTGGDAVPREVAITVHEPQRGLARKILSVMAALAGAVA